MAVEFLVPLYMAVNVASSISIVFLNKYIFQTYSFNFGYALTSIHFIVTFLGLQLCAMMGVFTIKRLAVRDVLMLSASFCGFVVFTNLSLQANSVGFYQLAKVMTTPVIVFIQTNFYAKVFSTPIKLSLIPILVGVSVNSYADISLNWVGFIYATLGVITTSFYQIWVNTKQKELEANSMQLLYYQAPISAVMLLVFMPLFEQLTGPLGLLSYPWTNNAMLAILGSGVVAFSVNLSIFLVIGKTSPVTYNVLGHFKLCIILLGGFLLFQEPLNYLQAIGITLTLLGVFLYTHISLKEQSATTVKKEDILSTLTTKQARVV